MRRLPTSALWLLLMSATALATDWKCPDVTSANVSCSCDFPHTLRCTTSAESLSTLSRRLRLLTSDEAVSLLDCAVVNATELPDGFLEGVALHGLIVTSGQLRRIADGAFRGLPLPLQALGLPNNRLGEVPATALSALPHLERLDLSGNELKRVNGDSFRMRDLAFLDLSENDLEVLNETTFRGLKKLTTLKLSSNRIGEGSAAAALRALPALEELDLSTNALAGPLTQDTFPPLPSLRTLLLSNNQFSSVRRGALTGASSLVNLSLNRNHIDVLEDHAFREVPTLRSLDLANNRIVAISGASLAHLDHLTELDLSHNFLRALTGDVFVPLGSLRVLRVDDNDISMVSSEGLGEESPLEKLSLSDNPLNCDCSLADFAEWLNASRLSADDKGTAVCMTPPHFENAVLADIPTGDLHCEDGDDAFPEDSVSPHVSSARIVLRAFNFDGGIITLLWSIDSDVEAFSCDALFVYEELSTHEVLLHSTPLRCNSSQLPDPTALAVRLPLGSMQAYHRYRYCVVLLEDDKFSDEMRLVLGCSEVIPLIATEKTVPQPATTSVARTRIASIDANATFNVLTVSVRLWNYRKQQDSKCRVTVTVFAMGSLLTQHVLNCSQPRIAIAGLPPGHYHVCATLGAPTETKLQCVSVKSEKLRGTSGSLLIVCFVLLAVFLLVGVYLLARRAVKSSRLKSSHQCFLATSEVDDDDDDVADDHKQHSRYVKLQTTTVM